RAELTRLTRPGDLVINLTSGVSSYDVAALCKERDVLYVDTSNESWEVDGVPAASTLTWERRDLMGALAAPPGAPPSATAVVGHGCNPGLVSHMTKKAMLELAARRRASGDDEDEHDAALEAPRTRAAWGALARSLGVRMIQIAERDTQHGDVPMEP